MGVNDDPDPAAAGYLGLRPDRTPTARWARAPGDTDS